MLFVILKEKCTLFVLYKKKKKNFSFVWNRWECLTKEPFFIIIILSSGIVKTNQEFVEEFHS